MRVVVALIASVTVSACSAGETQPNKEAPSAAKGATNSVREINCGYLVSSDQVAAYVASLHSRKSMTGRRDLNLFAANVTLTRHGKAVHLPRDQVEGFAGALPSDNDWEVIASAIQEGKLESGGWRGCFLAKGKAAFVADASGNIGLSAFDFDRPWMDK
jgi:hypothetical protein